MTPPVGFAGEFSTTSLVFADILERNASMSKDAPSGRSGTGTGVAPATSIIALYVGKPGSG